MFKNVVLIISVLMYNMLIMIGINNIFKIVNLFVVVIFFFILFILL